ncbi:MAG: hypothetical protein IJW38_02635 [Clostridia bacterium]|nr:hypothetical protein [Clostridia bacterium]
MKEKNTKNENIKNPPSYRNDNSPNATPGINSPDVAIPAFNPPVPNRAWTAMRNGVDIEELSEEEKRDLYIGNDDIM